VFLCFVLRLPTRGESGSETEKVKMAVKRKKDLRKQQEKRDQVLQPQAPPSSGIEQFLRVHGLRIVVLLCVYAGLRILLSAAAFPIFNPVDEQAHLLSIRMYAHGQLPGKDLPQVDAESAKLFSVYGTLEYLVPKETIEHMYPAVPLYQVSDREVYPYVAPRYMHWINTRNLEGQSAPLYYLLAAGWYGLGEMLGMNVWELAYWVRFLNSAAYALLIWTSYRLVQKVYPDRVFLWLGVPALLAVFPQDVYFGINREVLSAPMTAVALLLMIKAVDEKERGNRLLFLASALVGFTFLADVSNCVLYGALALALWFRIRRLSAEPISKAWIVIRAAFASLLLPSVWMLRNYLVMGDLTGSRAKIAILGWTTKPYGELLNHPLFSVGGAWYFLTNLVRTFWRGEYVWHAEPMSWPPADWFYVLSSVVMIAAFTAQVLRRWRDKTPAQQLTESQSLLLVVTSVLFMAVISLPFDFHQCVNPSREHPFFVSGRIISGALLPFVLTYVAGMDFLLRPIRKWIPPAAVLACLLLFITVTELQVRRVAFSSPYNFFALRSRQKDH
jgi:hypothetical protein